MVVAAAVVDCHMVIVGVGVDGCCNAAADRCLTLAVVGNCAGCGSCNVDAVVVAPGVAFVYLWGWH